MGLFAVKSLQMFFCLFISALLTVQAEDRLINVSPYSQLAIHGYDPVAYFVSGKATPGDRGIVVEHNGIQWAFASDSSRQIFIESPEAFVPQYGGHCAYAASRNAIADADPEAWQIVDGKLFLNYDNRVQRVWANQLKENVKLADKYWPDLQSNALTRQKP